VNTGTKNNMCRNSIISTEGNNSNNNMEREASFQMCFNTEVLTSQSKSLTKTSLDKSVVKESVIEKVNNMFIKIVEYSENIFNIFITKTLSLYHIISFYLRSLFIR